MLLLWRRSRIHAEAAAKCKEMLLTSELEITAAAGAPKATVASVMAAVDGAVRRYGADAQGPTRHAALADFMQKASRQARL